MCICTIASLNLMTFKGKILLFTCRLYDHKYYFGHEEAREREREKHKNYCLH